MAVCRAVLFLLVFLFLLFFFEVLVVGGPAGAGAAEGGKQPVRCVLEPVFDREAFHHGTDDSQDHDDEHKGADAVENVFGQFIQGGLLLSVVFTAFSKLYQKTTLYAIGALPVTGRPDPFPS